MTVSSHSITFCVGTLSPDSQRQSDSICGHSGLCYRIKKSFIMAGKGAYPLLQMETRSLFSKTVHKPALCSGGRYWN